MPTGYTAAIVSDKPPTFAEFAMNCARAMGACITLRDEPGGGDRIPEKFEPSDYYAKAIQQARGDLSRLDAMGPDDVANAAREEHEKAVRAWKQRRHDGEHQRVALHEMLQQVLDWNPPTAEHSGLKRFMVEQIETTIRHDCPNDDLDPCPASVPPTEWRAARRIALCDRVSYLTMEDNAETKRAKDRTAWIVALRASLVGTC